MKMDEMIETIKSSSKEDLKHYAKNIWSLMWDVEDKIAYWRLINYNDHTNYMVYKDESEDFNTIGITCEDGELKVRGIDGTLLFRKVSNWAE